MQKVRCYDGGYGLIQKYRIKIIVSGDVVEQFTYPRDCIRGYNLPDSVSDLTRAYGSEEMEKDRSEYSTLRAQQRIRNLVNCNFGPGDKMLTLTFASPVMQYLDDTNPIFHKFIRKLKEYCAQMKNARVRGAPIFSWRSFSKLRYLAVVEWQRDFFHKDGIGHKEDEAKENGGNVHYHLIVNIPYVDKEKIAELWGAGFIKIKRISDKKNVGAYFAKHGTKHDVMEEKKLKGRKKYFCSRGLMKPIEIYDSNEVSDFLDRHSLLKEFEKDVKSGEDLVVNYKQFKLLK